MALIDGIKEQAKANKKFILLPEGDEPRTIKAARIIADQAIAEIALIGDPEKIEAKARELNTDLAGIQIIDHVNSDEFEDFANEFYQMRKEKGITVDAAKKAMTDPLFYAGMMLKLNKADGMVAGAINTTGNTLRPGLQIVKMLPGISTVSSCFIMEVPNSKYGKNGVLVFADCAVNIDPTAEQLAAIAISSAKTAKGLCGIEPNVAMLSFSTKGSAQHQSVDKVVLATRLVKELAPDLNVDGELQADAALVESVGQLKSPGSKVAGHANVLIFPDLQSGNIGYKLVQRLANAEAIGPVCQGFAKPINDLSRGCSVEDIVSVVAITAVQAQSAGKE